MTEDKFKTYRYINGPEDLTFCTYFAISLDNQTLVIFFDSNYPCFHGNLCACIALS